MIKIFPASFNVASYGEQTVDQRTFSVLSFLYLIYFLISYFSLFLFLSFFLSFFPFLFFLVLSFPLFYLSFFLSFVGLPVPCVPGVPASSRTFFYFIFTFLPVCIRMLPFRMLPVCTRLGLVCYPYVCVRIRMSSVCTRMYSYVTRMYSCGVLVTINFKLVLIFSHQLHYLTQGFLVCINNKQNSPGRSNSTF